MKRQVARVLRGLLGSAYEPLKARLGKPPRRKPTRRERRVAQLKSLGLFDADLYNAQLSRAVDPDRVIDHYVRRGCQRELVFHALLEPEYLPEEVRSALAAGKVGALVGHLNSPASLETPWSPVFDPRQLGPEVSVESVHRFLTNLSEDTELPVPADSITRQRRWGDVREVALRQARLVTTQREFRRAKLFDSEAEVADPQWLARVDALEPPQALVSVIMPVRDRENEVGRAIESVRAQTHQNWELLVVDDGSVDGTAAAVRSLAAADPRVRYLHTDGGGVSVARNRGLEAAGGNVVAFLDSDNVWVPAHLELSLRGMAEAGAALVHASAELHRPDGEVVYRGQEVGLRDLLAQSLIDLNCVVVTTDLIRAVGGFEAGLKRWVDHDLLIRIARRSQPVHLPFVGVIYDDDADRPRITTRESNHWQFVVQERGIVDWSDCRRQLDDRVQGRLSVVMLATRDHRRTSKAVDDVLRGAGDLDVEVILVDRGEFRAVGRCLAARYADTPTVRYHRFPRRYRLPAAFNAGFARSSGEWLLFLDTGLEGSGDWLAAMVRRLTAGDGAAVLPRIAAVDPTVGPGTAPFAGSTWPPAGVGEWSSEQLATLAARALAVRAEDLVAVCGFDPIFAGELEEADFCLRVAAATGRPCVIEPGAVMTAVVPATPALEIEAEEDRRLFAERWGTGADPAAVRRTAPFTSAVAGPG